MISSDILKEIKDYLTNPNLKGVALSGAGISKESGISTFRKESGLWQKYDPSTYAYTEGLISVFLSNPEKLSNFIIDVYSPILEAKPNIAHRGLVKFIKDYNLTGVITQNIDNLHSEAQEKKGANKEVVELHGNIFRARCKGCGLSFMLSKNDFRKFIEGLKKVKISRSIFLRLYHKLYPKCKCGNFFRPDVVLFGEPLREEVINRAYQLLSDCSYVFLIGTSNIVYPASNLPIYAKENGAKIIEINPEVTQLSEIADYNIYEKAVDAFAEILNFLK